MRTCNAGSFNLCATFTHNLCATFMNRLDPSSRWTSIAQQGKARHHTQRTCIEVMHVSRCCFCFACSISSCCARSSARDGTVTIRLISEHVAIQPASLVSFVCANLLLLSHAAITRRHQQGVDTCSMVRVMLSYLLLCCLVAVPSATCWSQVGASRANALSGSPGVVGSWSQKGIDFGKTVLIDFFTEAVSSVALPEFHFDEGTNAAIALQRAWLLLLFVRHGGRDWCVVPSQTLSPAQCQTSCAPTSSFSLPAQLLLLGLALQCKGVSWGVLCYCGLRGSLSAVCTLKSSCATAH